MFTVVLIALFGIGHLTTGIPLEHSLEDMKQYFDGRILGGTPVKGNEAPHMVALMIGVDYKSFMCGGSIISASHILTAAHCITGFIWNGELMSSYHGGVGANEWRRGLVVEFLKHFIHPQYNPSTYKYDIAVLKMTLPLKFQHNIQPIELDYEHVEGGLLSTVTGWGNERLGGATPDFLNILHVHTLDAKICVEMAEALSGAWGPRVDPLVELCTLHSVGHGMCHGDSGSALSSKESGKQIGVVAWGWPCAVGGPDIFVRISPMRYFIEDSTKEN